MEKTEKISKNICPVCGKEELAEFEICRFCFWQNDPNQLLKPSLSGGANSMSLNQAREAYRKGEKIR